MPANRPIREWDLGKKEDLERDLDGGGRDRIRADRAALGAAGATVGRGGDLMDRQERRRRSTDRDKIGRNSSISPCTCFYALYFFVLFTNVLSPILSHVQHVNSRKKKTIHRCDCWTIFSERQRQRHAFIGYR